MTLTPAEMKKVYDFHISQSVSYFHSPVLRWRHKRWDLAGTGKPCWVIVNNATNLFARRTSDTPVVREKIVDANRAICDWMRKVRTTELLPNLCVGYIFLYF